jgi:hypothetical protein
MGKLKSTIFFLVDLLYRVSSLCKVNDKLLKFSETLDFDLKKLP